MSVTQALAIAAAAWVTAIVADPSANAVFHRAQSHAERLLARFESATALHLAEIKGGFRATPDGLRMERAVALR